MNRSPRSPIVIEPARIRRRRIGCNVLKLVVGEGLLLFFIPESGYQVSTHCAISALSAPSRRSPRLSCESFSLVSQQRRQRTQISDCRFQIADFRSQISDCRMQISDCRFQIADCRFQIADFRLQISDCRFQISDRRLQISDSRFQITDCRLQI